MWKAYKRTFWNSVRSFWKKKRWLDLLSLAIVLPSLCSSKNRKKEIAALLEPLGVKIWGFRYFLVFRLKRKGKEEKKCEGGKRGAPAESSSLQHILNVEALSLSSSRDIRRENDEERDACTFGSNGSRRHALTFPPPPSGTSLSFIPSPSSYLITSLPSNLPVEITTEHREPCRRFCPLVSPCLLLIIPQGEEEHGGEPKKHCLKSQGGKRRVVQKEEE